LNLGLQEGQTIKINLSGKMGERKEKPKVANTGGLGLLPPPPSKANPANLGSLVNLPPPPASTSNEDDFGDFSSSTNNSGWVSF